MFLAKDNNATEHENDRGCDQQLLEVFVGVISAPERVLALHVYNVNEGPAINCQAHEGYKL